MKIVDQYGKRIYNEHDLVSEMEDNLTDYLLSKLIVRLTERQILILWYRLNELTTTEIAMLLGISRTRVSQELKKMRGQVKRAWGV